MYCFQVKICYITCMAIENVAVNEIIHRGIALATDISNEALESTNEETIVGLNSTARSVALTHLLVGGKVHYELQIGEQGIDNEELDRRQTNLDKVDKALKL
jgi:hypothetical protein